MGTPSVVDHNPFHEGDERVECVQCWALREVFTDPGIRTGVRGPGRSGGQRADGNQCRGVPTGYRGVHGGDGCGG